MLLESEIKFIQKYPPNSESFLRQIKTMMDFEGRKQLNLIKTPVFIVNGTKGQFIPMELTDESCIGN